MSLKDSFVTQRPRAEISGLSGLPKIVIGTVIREEVEPPSWYNDTSPVPAPDDFVEREMKAFREARDLMVSENKKAIEHINAHAPFELRDPMRSIVEAEEMLITDPGLEMRVAHLVRSGQEAVYGVYNYFQDKRAELSKMANKAQDLEHKIEAMLQQETPDNAVIEATRNQMKMLQAIAQKRVEMQEVMNAYMGVLRHGRSPGRNLPENAVVVTPATNVGALGMYRGKDNSWQINGLINSEGNQLCHTAIVARAANLLRMVVEPSDLKRLQNGDTIVMDGIQGVVLINPDSETMRKYHALSDQYRNNYLQMVDQARQANGRILTADGTLVRANLNIAYSDEIETGLAHGSRRIGLYRTEIPPLISDTRLTPENWSDIFEHIFKQAHIAGSDKPAMVTLRTLDQSPDKEFNVDYFGVERDQIQAMYAARQKAHGARVCVMFPMVRGRADFDDRKKVVLEEAQNSGCTPLEVGAMIETPAAVNDMGRIQADFFSVGTNDLYFGVQGDNRYDPQHTIDETEPSFLRHLLGARKNADQADKRISICGDMASDLRMLPILIGLGYKEFSVGPSALPGLSAYIRRLHVDECSELAHALMDTRSSVQRWKMLEAFNTKHGLSHEGIIDMNWSRRDAGPERDLS